MKLKAFSTIPVVALVACTACAPPNQDPRLPERTSTVIDAPKEQVWPLIVEAIGLNYPIQAIEKASGLIVTSFSSLDAGFNNVRMEKWVYSPRGFLATWDGLRMNIKVLVVEMGDGKTQVTVKCHYEAYESNVRKYWVVAESNGSTENALLTFVESKINKR